MPNGTRPEPSELGKSLAKVIKAHMGFNNISQADMSRSAGIPQSTLSRILSGRRDADLNQLLQISEALRVPMSTLMRQAESVVADGGELSRIVTQIPHGGDR